MPPRTNMRDRTFSWEMRTWARMQSTTGKHSVYMYYFSHAPAPPQAVKGAYHGSEIPYAFGNLIVAPFAIRGGDYDAGLDGLRQKLADEMSSYWVNFATTGRSQRQGSAVNGLRFKTAKNEVVMSLGDTVEAKPVPNKAQLDFLDKYFEAQRAWVPNFRRLKVTAERPGFKRAPCCRASQTAANVMANAILTSVSEARQHGARS